MTVDTQVQAMTATQLYARLLANEPLFVLDVRNNDAFATWQIEGGSNLQTLNLPYFDFIEDEAASLQQVPTGHDVLVVCAKQGSSEYVAGLLAENGYRAAYLAGGIAAWGDFYDVRDVVTSDAGRIVQVARPARGDVSYIVISNGEAAIVDPLRHTDEYTRVVSAADATVTHIFDTHAHADHISGGPALAEHTGAPYFLHPYDAIHPMDMLPAVIAYTPLHDGQQYQVGNYRVDVIGYPGHTLGQVNFLFTAPDNSTYLFTGDGIFLRSFGRPDLGGQAETWTPILYRSMFEKLPQYVNDTTVILPSHFSVLSEANDAGGFVAPYGEVRQQNDALTPRSRDEFFAYVMSHIPVFPEQYIQIKRVNIGLVVPSEDEASELEIGKNVCALSE